MNSSDVRSPPKTGLKALLPDRSMEHRCHGERISKSMSTESEVEHVLGMTVFSNSTLTSNPISGVVAYPAGSVLMLLDSLKKQTSSLHCPGKMITAVNFSPDGKLLLIGECGHPALARVWRTDIMQEIARFGQFTGVECMSFTPSMREIVVVGNSQDMTISLWSWPKKVMLSLNKFSDNVCAMSVADDGSFFVTVGNRHMKFYCVEVPNPDVSCAPMPLPTKCVSLDFLTDSCFCDVMCGRKENKSIFAISSSGILCQISRHRRLEKWVRVDSDKGYCLATDNSHVFVGCSGGVVQMFNASSLQLVSTLPQPHSLGIDISLYSESTRKCKDDVRTKRTKGRRRPCYPAVKAMVYDTVHHNLTSVYDDCSIYIWSRTEDTFEKRYSSLFHCGCIWDFTLYPLTKQDACSDEIQGGALPPGSLITVSADGTLRSWDVTSNISEESTLKRNPVSSACLKIIYAGGSLEDHPIGMEGTRPGTRMPSSSSLSSARENIKACLARGGRDVFSVVAVCPEGLHIATGNRHGELCIYDAYSMETLTLMVAHEAEITVIRYMDTLKYKIFASGSRDRLIHVMDASNNYQLMSTIDDHSSTITAIHFTSIGRLLMMVSSSLDMSVLVRTYNNDTSLSFRHVRAVVEKKAVVDFALHPWSGQIALVCQDQMVHIHNIMSMHDSFSYRGCPANGGHLVKISAEPSGLYILTACTKKTVNLIEFETGEILKTYSGHAESVTRVQFSLNLRHIISSSSDGCIFFWKLPETVTYSVKLLLAEMGLLTRGMVLGGRWKKSTSCNTIPPIIPMVRPDNEAALAIKESRSSAGTRNQFCTLNSSFANTKWDGYQTLLSDGWISPGYTVWNGISSIDRLHKFLGQDMQDVCFRSGSFQRRLGSSFDTWMTACCRRRKLFKLEAKSIKRILTMMELVADAMEKDLQNTNNTNPRGKLTAGSLNPPHNIDNCNKVVRCTPSSDSDTFSTVIQSLADLSTSSDVFSEEKNARTDETYKAEGRDKNEQNVVTL